MSVARSTPCDRRGGVTLAADRDARFYASTTEKRGHRLYGALYACAYHGNRNHRLAKLGSRALPPQYAINGPMVAWTVVEETRDEAAKDNGVVYTHLAVYDARAAKLIGYVAFQSVSYSSFVVSSTGSVAAITQPSGARSISQSEVVLYDPAGPRMPAPGVEGGFQVWRALATGAPGELKELSATNSTLTWSGPDGVHTAPFKDTGLPAASS